MARSPGVRATRSGAGGLDREAPGAALEERRDVLVDVTRRELHRPGGEPAEEGAYPDAGDRARKRATMMSDPEWLNYLKLADEAGYLVDQRNSLMMPASFAPIKR